MIRAVGFDNPLKVVLLLLRFRPRLLESGTRGCEHLRREFLLDRKLLIGPKLRCQSSRCTDCPVLLLLDRSFKGGNVLSKAGNCWISRSSLEHEIKLCL